MLRLCVVRVLLCVVRLSLFALVLLCVARLSLFALVLFNDTRSRNRLALYDDGCKTSRA